MSHIRKPAVVVAAGVAAMALATGCGGTTSAGTSTPPAQAPTSAASHASTQPAGPSSGSSGSAQSSTSTPPSSAAPATEFSPPGDIPDNQVFVPYSLPGTNLQVNVPEGWARSTQHGETTFTDKLNSIGIQVVPQPKAPTVASASRVDVPQLASSVSQYASGAVSLVSRQSGQAVLLTYQQDSPPDPVTGKVVRDAVERYEFWKAGKEAIITLSGPVGADNVDPWRTVTDSVTWK